MNVSDSSVRYSRSGTGSRTDQDVFGEYDEDVRMGAGEGAPSSSRTSSGVGVGDYDVAPSGDHRGRRRRSDVIVQELTPAGMLSQGYLLIK